MRITDLTEKQMEIIADNRPSWMADNHPDWMADHHPDWDEVPENIVALINS